MVACWYLWKRRNKKHIWRRFSTSQQMLFSRWQWRSIVVNKHMRLDGLIKRKLFSWGGNGLMMVGSSSIVMVRIKAQLTFSECGGLLRNSNDIYLISYARKIGTCDAFHAEMRAMYLGLELARRQGITHLQVESDSKVLVDTITRNCNINGCAPLPWFGTSVNLKSWIDMCKLTILGANATYRL